MRVFSNIYCPLKFEYAYMYFYFNPFSVWPRFYLFTMNHYTSMRTYISYVHMFQMSAQFKRLYIMQIHFAEFCRGQSVTASKHA